MKVNVKKIANGVRKIKYAASSLYQQHKPMVKAALAHGANYVVKKASQAHFKNPKNRFAKTVLQATVAATRPYRTANRKKK